MPQHHGRAEDHGRGVGAVGTHDITGNMTTSRFEESVFLEVASASDLETIKGLYSPVRRCNRGRFLGHRREQRQCWRRWLRTSWA